MLALKEIIDKYDEHQERLALLDTLEQARVDNRQGYSHAHDILKEEKQYG